MAASFTPLKVVDTGDVYLAIGTLALSGNYAAGGESLATTFDVISIKSSRQVIHLVATGVKGHFYEYNYATDKLMVRECAGSAAVAGEIAASGYPVTVTGDTITVTAFFEKL